MYNFDLMCLYTNRQKDRLANQGKKIQFFILILPDAIQFNFLTVNKQDSLVRIIVFQYVLKLNISFFFNVVYVGRSQHSSRPYHYAARMFFLILPCNRSCESDYWNLFYRSGLDLAEWLECLTANTKVSKVLGSIPASSDSWNLRGGGGWASK